MISDSVKILLARYQFLRFVISGGFATLTNLVVVYVCTDLLHIYYLTSSVLSFIVAFVVSFMLQKYWTFEDVSSEKVHRQLVTALAVALANLCLNIFLMYTFVEYVGLHYLLSQIVASALIAIETFFVFRYVIFRVEL